MTIEASRIAEEVSPFLARFAVRRYGDDQLPGRYCLDRHVWVVDTDDGPRPLIMHDEVCAATETVTRVRAEQSDLPDATRFAGTTAGTTVTAVAMEQTDTRGDVASLYLDATITEVRAEQTDR